MENFDFDKMVGPTGKRPGRPRKNPPKEGPKAIPRIPGHRRRTRRNPRGM